MNSSSIRLPALRFGEKYHSMTRHPVVDLGSGQELASLGLVLDSMIAIDCGRGGLLDNAFQILRRIPVRDRISMSVRAAAIFEHETLDCGGVPQTPEDYIDVLSRTSGLSHALARANTARICQALLQTEAIMDGLSRGLPLNIYDTGLGTQGGATVRLNPRIKALGACMPNNSPGVHVIWLISLAFGIPVLIRPGSSEPFTPYRLIQAFIKAGFPPEAFGYYPCDHAAANRIPELTGGGIVFGSDDTVKKWKGFPNVHVHGSGFSKLFIGPDRIDDWKNMLGDIATSVSMNSGRSCFAVSTIVVPRHARDIADALARELSTLVPRSLDDQRAMLSAMAMPAAARSIDGAITAGIAQGGATDMSAAYRQKNRLVEFQGRTYLLPTVILCDSLEHPLARTEYLFPYVAVVEMPIEDALKQMGPTLSLAIYTNDGLLKVRAQQSRVPLVSINKPTVLLDRKQPHEENLFELLYERGSFVS